MLKVIGIAFIICLLENVASALVKGGAATRSAAVAVDPSGAQLPTDDLPPPPLTIDELEKDWPVYPAGEPRAGEPIMPVLAVRTPAYTR